MTRRMIRRDPIENEIELALSPGSYIRDRACFSFVSSLVEVAAQIAELQTTDAERAAGLYETCTVVRRGACRGLAIARQMVRSVLQRSWASAPGVLHTMCGEVAESREGRAMKD